MADKNVTTNLTFCMKNILPVSRLIHSLTFKFNHHFILSKDNGGARVFPQNTGSGSQLI